MINKNLKSFAIHIVFQFVVSLLLLSVASAISFSGKNEINSNTGYTQLSWEKNENSEVELQQSLNSNFENIKLVYKGSDKAVFLSGLKNNTYFYRIREINDEGLSSEWSEIKTLTVKHHSIASAMTLFVVGLVSFIAILLVIFFGHRLHQQQMSKT